MQQICEGPARGNRVAEKVLVEEELVSSVHVRYHEGWPYRASGIERNSICVEHGKSLDRLKPFFPREISRASLQVKEGSRGVTCK